MILILSIFNFSLRNVSLSFSLRVEFEIIRGLSKEEQRILAREVAKSSGAAKSNKHFKKLVKDGVRRGMITSEQINKVLVNRLVEVVSSPLGVINSQVNGKQVSANVIVYIVTGEN